MNKEWIVDRGYLVWIIPLFGFPLFSTLATMLRFVMYGEAIMFVTALVLVVALALLILNRRRIARWARRRDVRRLIRRRMLSTMGGSFSVLLFFLGWLGEFRLLWVASLAPCIWSAAMIWYFDRIERYVIRRRAIQAQRSWSRLCQCAVPSVGHPHREGSKPKTLSELSAALEPIDSLGPDKRSRFAIQLEDLADDVRALARAQREDVPAELHALLDEQAAEDEAEAVRLKALRVTEDELAYRAHHRYINQK